jgi:hypothetical protein
MTYQPLNVSKTGNCAFSVTVAASGETLANGRTFKTPRDAYDWHYDRYMRSGDHADWNVCYTLDDVLADAL